MKYVAVSEKIAEKFRMFLNSGRIMYFFAPCGFGKTTVANELLKNKKYITLSPESGEITADALKKADIVLIDDMQRMDSEEERQCLLLSIRENPQKRFVLLSRSRVPGWLMPFQVSGLLVTVEYDELFLSRSQTAAVFKSFGTEPGEQEITDIFKRTFGYPLAVTLTAREISRKTAYDTSVYEEIADKIYFYFDDAIFRRLEIPMRRFLMNLAPFEDFEAELAKIANGDSHAGERLADIMQNTGMIISKKRGVFRFWPFFRKFLMWEMHREYSDEQIRTLYGRGGLYYELKENYGKALEFYSKSGDSDKVSELIIKSASLHPGMGHYDELERYFAMLSEEQILAVPSLMQGMSMLCALRADYDGSERWYAELEKFAASKNKFDEAAKEARGRIAYLDIALPQRSINGIAKAITVAARLLANKEIRLAPFSVTSALPSIMNGGKDFSDWSKKDDLLYKTMRKPVEIILGKDGIGLADCAIAESKFEKGEESSGQIITLVSRLSEIQAKGTPDIEFALVGLLARSQMLSGCADAAAETVNALRIRFAEQGKERFLANIDALLCQIALKQGDMMYVGAWYREKAPKDILKISILKRCQYLTRAAAEIALGNNDGALLTLAPLEPFFTACSRHINMIHLKILSAVAKYRKGSDWRPDMERAMEIAENYSFVRTVGEYGIAVLPLLNKGGFKGEFAEKVIKTARAQAVYYPEFLQTAAKQTEKLTDAEMQVLRLVCADKSNAEIGEILNIKLATVKSHTSHILQKLGASRRSEAKTIAKKLKII